MTPSKATNIGYGDTTQIEYAKADPVVLYIIPVYLSRTAGDVSSQVLCKCNEERPISFAQNSCVLLPHYVKTLRTGDADLRF